MNITKITSYSALFCAVAALGTSVDLAFGQTSNSTPAPAARPTRPPPPTRDPNTPGYVTARELPDGEVPPVDVDGNFILGPTHNRALEMVAQTNVPQGTIYNFTMSSADSKIYPGIAREPGTFG